MFFYTAAIGQFFSYSLIEFWAVRSIHTVGSISYLICSLLGFWGWYDTLDIDMDNKQFNKNLDVLFSVVYIVALGVSIIGIAYSVICKRFIEDFILANIVSIAVLIFESVRIKYHDCRYKYIKWFIRCFMIVYALNEGHIIYRLSGECGKSDHDIINIIHRM